MRNPFKPKPKPEPEKELTYLAAMRAMSRNHEAWCSCESCRVIARTEQAWLNRRDGV